VRQIEISRDAAEAAGRAKDRFLAVLSHELRTPLNPILLAITAILEGAIPNEDLPAALEMIRRNVELEARLIDDLLDLSRIAQGKLTLRPLISHGHDLIKRAVDICRDDIEAKRIRIEYDLSAEHHRIKVDEARLQQVFWNLIKNAIKFTTAGGTLAIRTRNVVTASGRDGQLIIEFVDSGIGIEPDFIRLIFDPFQQGEASSLARSGGLGLGLTISRGIIEAHGGTLTAESPGREMGATFRVALRTGSHGESPADPIAPQPGMDHDMISPTSTSLRVLLVEDEPETLKVMTTLLHWLGHVVTTASTFAVAVESAESCEFDLIISDIGLPDGSGLDLLRRNLPRRTPPAIAVSGFGMDEDILRSREAGFAAHLTKPIGFKELQDTIRQLTS
jgi:CheY-like chemotaxis protein